MGLSPGPAACLAGTVSAQHLAQLNVAIPRLPLDDPEMAEFMAALDAVNAVADASPGFVWRLVAEGSNNATDLRAPVGGVPQMINMSVWDSREALWTYVYRSEHVDFLRRRSEWFERPADPHLVLWWVPAGELPTVDDGLARLDLLRTIGPSEAAFTFRESTG